MFAVLGNRRLTDETLQTTICIVEQTLNARPLTPVSSDPNDLEALTPNHFLLGRANIAVPFFPSAENYAVLSKSFKAAQAYASLETLDKRSSYPQSKVETKWTKGN